MSDPQSLLAELHADRWAAHTYLFPHRHKDAACEAHVALVEAIHGKDPRLSIEGFRRFGKTTYLEEAVLLKAGFREFHNLVFLGASFERACDRVTAVKNEIMVNERLQQAFGPLRGNTWQDGKIVLSNGVCIQALGRGQSILGMKHLEWRPDAFIMDDLEDPREKLSDPERTEAWRWFRETFLLALDDPLLSWGRFAGTRRGKGSIPERLEIEMRVPTVKYPIEYLDAEGHRRSTWPGAFPLRKIDELKRLYRDGMDTWAQEMMCQPSSAEDRPFQAEHIRVVPRPHSWEAAYAFIDPASSVNRGSATTGWAVWSWIRNRLVVWDAGAERLLPDAVVALAYDLALRFDPVWLGVERDGLNQFLLQPLRQEQVKRGLAFVPIRPVRAIEGTRGMGKIPFIRGLQPFFAAGEVEFAKPLPDLVDQLLSFPHGPIDAPNALAYALMMRPGVLLYDQFSAEHVAEAVPLARAPLWLACNATPGQTVAAALQYSNGRIAVLADWALDAGPAEAVPLIVREAGMAFRVTPAACCPPEHFNRLTNVGLAQALRRIPLEAEAGAASEKGRDLLRGEFGKLMRGEPAVRVARAAKLTLNALAGGYSRRIGRDGQPEPEAEPGIYRLLMEGVESCLGRMAVAAEIEQNANWAYTTSGRRYLRYGRAEAR